MRLRLWRVYARSKGKAGGRAFEGGLTNCLQIVGDCIEDGEELVEPGHGEDLADGIGGSGEGELGGLPACGLGEGEEGAQAHGA